MENKNQKNRIMINAKKEIVFHEKQIGILQMLLDLDNRISSYQKNLKMIGRNDFMNMISYYDLRIKKSQEMKIRIEKYYINKLYKNIL